LLKQSEPTRQAAILVGGLGTRLGSLTEACPKPLLEVAGEPFLGHLMRHLLRFGFNDFLLLAGYLADQVAVFGCDFADRNGVSVRICIEPEPAGTAGALFHAKELLADEFILLNGDTIFNFNLLDLGTRQIDFEWQGRVALRQVPDTSRFGRVSHKDGRITAMREKVAGQGEGTINAGVYWLRRAVLDRIQSLPCSMEEDILPALIAEGSLAGFAYQGAFIDIGVPADLAFAQERWAEFVERPAVFFDRDGVLNHDTGYTHSTADFRWTKDAVATIRACNDADRYVFVVTNQAGVARGFYDEEAINELHHWMNADLRRAGAHIDAFAYCPHHPEGVVPGYNRACSCRKPAPGMINELLSAWPVVTDKSFMVGDKPSDLEAANAAGLLGVRVTEGGDNLASVVDAHLGCPK
jgi:D,D-heptose 1,7-bisphosphate phosphatase